MLSHFLASVSYGEETVGVCLSCQLVKISTFANQLTDDVNILLRDSFTYRTVFDERTDHFALSHQAMRIADMTDGVLLYISFPFESVFSE